MRCAFISSTSFLSLRAYCFALIASLLLLYTYCLHLAASPGSSFLGDFFPTSPLAMTKIISRAFESRPQLEEWLSRHHSSETELWVRIFKKASNQPSIDWNNCVLACLAWGWIDGQKKSLDENSFLQRITPRRPRSNWSKKNREHAEQLILEGKMQSSGLVHVEAARADGRFEQAYAGSADMVLPEEFHQALAKNPIAKQRFETLKRAQIYSIYHAIHTAKRIETRQKRIAKAIADLADGKKIGQSS